MTDAEKLQIELDIQTRDIFWCIWGCVIGFTMYVVGAF